MIGSISLAKGATWAKSVRWRSKLPLDVSVWPVTGVVGARGVGLITLL